VVTLTTVGYGDIAPHTVPGRFIAAFVMFSGYGLIACPLVLNTQTEEEALKQGCECVKCFRSFHQNDANFCRHCGTALRFPENKFKRLQSKKAAKKLQLEKQAAAIAAAAAAGGHSNIAEITPMSMIQLQEQLKRQQQQDEEEEEEHEEEEETIMLKRPLKGAEAVL
jgi:predicted  nucleic acid-binding Zn-ribbon protein